MRLRCAVPVLVVLAVTPSWLAAQQQPPQPGTIVVSQNKCNLSTTGQLNTFVRENFAPILNELVQEGKLLSWGVLEHNWGDEWNWVLYYLARDRDAFFAAWTEATARLRQRVPNFMQSFGAFCSEHKDNIYSVRMTESMPMR